MSDSPSPDPLADWLGDALAAALTSEERHYQPVNELVAAAFLALPPTERARLAGIEYHAEDYWTQEQVDDIKRQAHERWLAVQPYIDDGSEPVQ